MFVTDLDAFLSTWVRVLGQGDDAMQVMSGGESNFQPYIFWAYGLACVLLLLFSVWTARQLRGLDERVRELTTRFDEASAKRSRPGSVPPSPS